MISCILCLLFSNCMRPRVVCTVCCSWVTIKFYGISGFCIAGGTFALYSLLCRHANVKTIPNQHRTDEELTTYSRSTFHEQSYAAKTKKWLEGHASRKNALLLLVLVGTCMVIGDGILTPAISGTHFLTLEVIYLFLIINLFILFVSLPLFVLW